MSNIIAAAILGGCIVWGSWMIANALAMPVPEPWAPEIIKL